MNPKHMKVYESSKDNILGLFVVKGLEKKRNQQRKWRKNKE